MLVLAHSSLWSKWQHSCDYGSKKSIFRHYQSVLMDIWRERSFLILRTNSNIKEYSYAFLQWTELYCHGNQITTDFFKCAEKWISKFYILLTVSYSIRLHLTTPTIHYTMFYIKRNFSWCSAVSTMTFRWSIGWRGPETTVLLDTCTKSTIRKR